MSAVGEQPAVGAREGTAPLHDLNCKDQPGAAAQWLDYLGDPYTPTGANISGRVAIDWGVYGLSETFVAGADRHVAYKYIGPVNEVLTGTILPDSLRKRAAGRNMREGGQ